VELNPLRHVENDACEQARGPRVQLKKGADVRWEGPETSAAGPSSTVLNRIERILIFGHRWTFPDSRGPDDHPARLFLRFLTDQGESAPWR
jgi:hypothetical protein